MRDYVGFFGIFLLFMAVGMYIGIKKGDRKMMRDNKHQKAQKLCGFWDFVVRDAGDYVGKHRHGPGMHPVEWLIEPYEKSEVFLNQARGEVRAAMRGN